MSGPSVVQTLSLKVCASLVVTAGVCWLLALWNAPNLFRAGVAGAALVALTVWLTRSARRLFAELAEVLELQQSEHRALQRSEAELRLMGQISRTADRSEDLDAALLSCCQLVCRFLCWPVGHIYLVDAERGLVPSDLWHLTAPELVSGFVEATRGRELSSGEDLPGRVLAAGDPEWIEDCWADPEFVRSSPGEGAVRAGVAFPARVADDTIAVIEMYDIEPRAREPRTLALMNSIGLTLGQVLHRRRTNELLQSRNVELAEAASAAQAATQAKTAFLANMSHEIRTPMTAIVGFAEIIESASDNGESERVVATIKRNIRHLLQLLNDILDVSKIEAGRMQLETIRCSPVRILHEVGAAVGPRARAKGLDFRITLSDPLPELILTDPTRLQQILPNLATNAVKFTERGNVHVRAGMIETETAPRLYVEVEDSGVGITPEQLERLFKPFSQADQSTTRRFGGTGLGLSICKSLAELLGGGIEVRSDPGAGSCFRVEIEARPVEGVRLLHDLEELDERDVMPLEPSTIDGLLDTQRILVAEDGPDNQRLIQNILASAGADVEIVENGQLAVERALKADESGLPFDIVLMDIQMPVMDGYEATRRLRSRGYRGRVVALTANAMKGDAQKCLSAGCDEFLSKPISRTALVQALNRG